MATSLREMTALNQFPQTEKLFQSIPPAPKGYLGPAETTTSDVEMMQAKNIARENVGKADIGIEQARRDEKTAELTSQAELEKEFAERRKNMPEMAALKEGREKLRGMEFVPTKDTVQDIAGLFSLIGVIGMAVGGGGRMASQQAMGAMNGMMEGYRKGRTDLFKKEQIEFDKNFKAMQTAVSSLKDEYSEALEIEKTDKEAGRIARAMALNKAGSPVLKAMEAKQGAVNVMNTINDLDKSVKTSVTQYNTLKAKSDAEAAAERRHREAMAQRERLANLQREAKSPATKAQGQNALTFASRVYGNIENATNDLVNLTNLPAVAESPIFAGMIGADRDTVLRNITAFAARKVTNKDQRAFEQIANSLDAALARLEAQGLATGATKAAIQSFGTLKPREGDDAINMAIYLARVKQEIETGIKVHAEMPGATPGQKQNNIQNIERINKTVPFSVEDTLNVLKANRRPLGKKMEQLLSQPQIVPNTSMESQSTRQTQRQNFSSIQEAEAANLAPGTEITINGRNAIVE